MKYVVLCCASPRYKPDPVDRPALASARAQSRRRSRDAGTAQWEWEVTLARSPIPARDPRRRQECGASRSTGRSLSASMISSFALEKEGCFSLRRPCVCAFTSCAIGVIAMVDRTVQPAVIAARPSPTLRCVVPTPGGPGEAHGLSVRDAAAGREC